MSITNFNYKIEIYDGATLLAVVDYASRISFERTQNSGCGIFNITLGRRFDNYVDIVDYGNEVKIYINNVLYYTGFIVDFLPTLQLNEEVQITGIGYIEQLNWQKVNQTYAGYEVTDLIEKLITDFIVPYGDVSIGTIESSGEIIDTITFEDTSVKDCIQTLQDICGINLGIDENKEFNTFWSSLSDSKWDVAIWDVNLWNGKVKSIHIFNITEEVEEYQVINSSADLWNYVVFRGGKLLSGLIYTYFLGDASSQSTYGVRQTIETNSSITTDKLARKYVSAKLNSYKDPTKRTRIKVKNYVTKPVNEGDMILVRNGLNTGTHQVVNAIYDIDDSGLSITIEADRLAPMWSVNWKKIERKLSNVQTQL